MVLIFLVFFGGYSLFHLFYEDLHKKKQSPSGFCKISKSTIFFKEHLGCFCNKSESVFFAESINFIVEGPNMEHSYERTLSELGF